MKRLGNLFPEIASFENLLAAAKDAAKGKRFRDPVFQFNFDLERNLFDLQRDLQEKTYQPGSYKTFVIHDPKRRMISAAPFRDRVVHHALCRVIEPVLEPTYIFDSYANRKGKGSHRALERFKSFARRYKYILRCDIRKYFPSMDHEILKEKIRRKIKCPETLWLLDTIVDSSNPQEPVYHLFQGDDLFTPLERRHGLPIGNLTSQYFAIVYLNDFDHWVKETLGCKAYLRYVDDFALFDNDKDRLVEWKARVVERVEEERLRLHQIKSQIHATRKGCEFVGFRVLPTRVRVGRKALVRAKKRINELKAAYARGEVDLGRVHNSIQSWVAHLRYGDTYRLREDLSEDWVFQRAATGEALG